LGDQATKGTWWMSWYQKLMKDVAGCDKLRGVAKQALIRRIPNWETCRKKHIVFLLVHTATLLLE